jgi:hypothetical protein
MIFNDECLHWHKTKRGCITKRHFYVQLNMWQTPKNTRLVQSVTKGWHSNGSLKLHIPPSKGKALPVQALISPKGSRRLSLPGFSDNRHIKVTRLSDPCTGRLYPRKDRWYSYPSAIVRPEGLSHWKISKTPSRTYAPVTYKVVQIWPGHTVTCLHTNSPGHIWTTLHIRK